MKKWEKQLYVSALGELAGVKAEHIDERAVLERTLQKLRLSETGQWETEAPTEQDTAYLYPAKKRSAWGFGLAAAAACLVIFLFAVNACAPSFTENLPVLGGFFRVINGGGHTPSPSDPLPPESVPAPTVKPEELDWSFEVELVDLSVKARSLTLSLRAKTDLLLQVPNPSVWEIQLLSTMSKPDGTPLGEQERIESNEIKWTRESAAGELLSSYLAEIELPLPEDGVPKEREMLLELSFDAIYRSADDRQKGREQKINCNLEVPLSWGEGAEKNGIVLEPFYLRKNKTADGEAWELDINVTTGKSGILSLYLLQPDGLVVETSGEGKYAEVSNPHYRFHIPEEDRQGPVILQVVLNGGIDENGIRTSLHPGHVLAEFELDLQKGTAEPIERFMASNRL